MKRNPLSELTRAGQGSRMEVPPPRRPPLKQVSLRLPVPVWRVFRRMAYEDERSIQSFLLEGVDSVLSKYGQPSAAEIVAAAAGRDGHRGGS